MKHLYTTKVSHPKWLFLKNLVSPALVDEHKLVGRQQYLRQLLPRRKLRRGLLAEVALGVVGERRFAALRDGDSPQELVGIELLANVGNEVERVARLDGQRVGIQVGL